MPESPPSAWSGLLLSIPAAIISGAVLGVLIFTGFVALALLLAGSEREARQIGVLGNGLMPFGMYAGGISVGSWVQNRYRSSKGLPLQTTGYRWALYIGVFFGLAGLCSGFSRGIHP